MPVFWLDNLDAFEWTDRPAMLTLGS